MKVSVFFVFALAISLSCIAITSASFAKMLECERYGTSGEGYFGPGAYDSWFPKKISLSSKKFKAIPGKKSILFHQNGNFVNNTSDVKIEFKLLPTGVLLKSSPGLAAAARYKCNMKPEEVLAAQASPSTPSTAANGCLDGNLVACDDDFICQKATSARSGSREWETTRTWESYVKEAKRRGLSCGVSEASSQSTTQSSTSSTTSTPSKADKSKAFCKDIGFTAGTEKFGECVLKMMDK